MPIQWFVNYEESFADPYDGQEPFTYWWEDMRAKEVLALVKEAYERGYSRGVVEGVELNEHRT